MVTDDSGFGDQDRAKLNTLWDEVKPLAEDTNRLVTFLVEDLYGPETVDVSGNHERKGGRLDQLTAQGIKVHIPGWLVTIIVASMALLGTIAAATITAVWGN